MVLGLAVEILSSDWHKVLLHSQVTRTVLKNRKQTSRGESCTLSKKIKGLIYKKGSPHLKSENRKPSLRDSIIAD